MTESEFMTSTDPQAMLQSLGVPQRHRSEAQKVSDRKLRLFAVACCRSVFPMLADERSRKAVEVAERYADGEASREEINEAWHSTGKPWTIESVACNLSLGDPAFPALAIVGGADEKVIGPCPDHATQAALLREIVGSPWSPVTLARSWLTPPVLDLARSAYKERGRKCPTPRDCVRLKREADYTCSTCHGTGRIGDEHLDPGTLAILADALEEAGCTSADLLGHLRGYERLPRHVDADQWGNWPEGNYLLSGPHVRGCHVLDAILGKE